MAISWGAFLGHMRVGIEAWCDPMNVNTTSVNVYVAYHVQADSTWTFNDDQALVTSNGIFGYTNRLGPNGAMHVATVTIPNQEPVYYGLYGGGPDYKFDAYVSGHYEGAQPLHTLKWPLPPKPPNVPTQPGVLLDKITATSVEVGVFKPEERGSAIVEYENAISLPGGDFSGRTLTWMVAGAENNFKTVTGLKPQTVYKAASRARNGVGWSAFFFTGNFTTTGAVPGAPTGGVSSLVTSTTARVAWTAPADNGGSAITGYEMQLSTTSNFASPFTYSISGNSIDYSSLQSNTTYYTRTRAKNAVGLSAFSPTVTFKTLMAVSASGPAGTLAPFQTITLTGSDANDTTVASRKWTLVSGGTGITISGDTAQSATAYVPGTLNGTTLTFRYTVTPVSGTAVSVDVVIPVRKALHRAVIAGVEVPMDLRFT